MAKGFADTAGVEALLRQPPRRASWGVSTARGADPAAIAHLAPLLTGHTERIGLVRGGVQPPPPDKPSREGRGCCQGGCSNLPHTAGLLSGDVLATSAEGRGCCRGGAQQPPL